MSKNIFICYRRDDAEGYPRLLRDHLNARFPGRIFMDVISIAPGADFTAVIQDRVGSCHALIAVIGRSWLTPDSAGRRRVDDPGDYVRREIAAALSRSHVAVIPVLVRKAQMPSRESLPTEIAALSTRNAIEMTEEDFDHDVDRLISALEFHFGESFVPQPPPPPKKSRATCIVLAVAGVLLAFLGLILLIAVLSAMNSSNGLTPTPAPTYSPTPSDEPTVDPGPVSGVDFVPDGGWAIQFENGQFVTIIFAQDGSYQSSVGPGTWSYSHDTRKLTLHGWGTITVGSRSANGFDGEAYEDGQTFRVRLIPQD
jgi:hypothetical protein